MLKCENGVAKSGGKLAAAIVTCHIKSAGAQFKGQASTEETCEGAALTKYNAANAKLTGCPPCLNTAMLATNAESQLDTLANALVFCDAAGTPLGDGDDSGHVPTTKASLKCEGGVAKNIGKLAAAVVTCHIKAATGIFKGKGADDESCEQAARTKFTAAIGKLATATNCPCVATTGLDGLVEAGVDALNGSTYCASPSGAFVE